MSYPFIATEPYSIQTILHSRKHARSSSQQIFANCLLFPLKEIRFRSTSQTSLDVSSQR